MLLAELHSDEPEATVLKSATPEWKQQIVEQIAGPRPRPNRTRVWLAAAAAIAIAVGGAWYFARSSPNAGLKLVAQAYSAQRPFEMRIAGADYQPNVRGAVSAGSLNETISTIGAALEKDPDNIGWLRARAEASLLQQDPAQALELLGKAAALTPGDTDVLSDTAISYMLRAEMSGQSSRAMDLTQAIDLLTQAILKQPAKADLFFNRALAYERLPEPQLAIKDWERFLKLESAGGWADEARRRLERQKQLAGQQAARVAAGEESILPLAAQGFRESGSAHPQQVADLLAAQNRDTWLRDLLAQNSASFPLLEQASKETSAGHEAIAEPLWAKASLALRASGNVPGLLFADLERAYSLQRMSQPADCLRIAESTLPIAKARGYSWIEAQLYLTEAGCHAQQNDSNSAYAALDRAQAIAASADYDIQSLQALGLQAAALRQIGAYREALRRDAEGIARYWKGQGNRGRAYQFYLGLALDAAALRHTRVAGTFMQAAATLAPNPPVEALLRSRYAELLAGDGDIQGAETEFRRAADILSSQPKELQLYQAYADLARSKLAVQAGRASEALEQLSRMSNLSSSIKNATIDAHYWHLQASALLLAGREKESDAALEHVLALQTSASADPSALAREISEAVKLLVDRELARGHAESALRLWTRYNPAFRSLPENSKAVRLIYAMLPSGPAVWISSSSGTSAVRVSDVHRMPVLLSSIRQLLARANDADLTKLRAAGQELYRSLIAPVEHALQGATEISISPDATFAAVPFGLLVTNQGQWLADQYRVSYSPPLVGVGITARPDRGSLLAVNSGSAAWVMHWTLPTLPDLDHEVQSAAASFPQHTILAGHAATREAVLRGLPEASVFHFSGHAVVTANDAALVLAEDQQDRLLWASRIPKEALKNLRFAMLAGCSTGKVGSESDDPAATMARSFLLAGVPSVIAARWDVDSTATGVFVDGFYAALRKGASPEEALHLSARGMRTRSAFSHPYYWAAFDMFRI